MKEIFNNIKNIKENIKESNDKFIQYKIELLNKYKANDYINIKSTREIRELYYNADEGTMCVINECNIYVSREKYFEWERYKYDKKRDMLILIFNPDDDCEVRPYYIFTPNKKAIRAIKNKDRNELTNKELAALKHHDNNIRFYRETLIILLIGLLYEIIKRIYF